MYCGTVKELNNKVRKELIATVGTNKKLIEGLTGNTPDLIHQCSTTGNNHRLFTLFQTCDLFEVMKRFQLRYNVQSVSMFLTRTLSAPGCVCFCISSSHCWTMDSGEMMRVAPAGRGCGRREKEGRRKGERRRRREEGIQIIRK